MNLSLRPLRSKSLNIAIAIGIFVVTAVYALCCGAARTILAGAGVAFLLAGAFPSHRFVAILCGALVIVLLQTRGMSEGFQGGSGSGSGPGSGSGDAGSGPPPTTESFSDGRKPVLPDNADRLEVFELGKPYRLPSESDDKGFHLDAGTTFLNAYKALKPDQIAAMTRDTQELLTTQRSLVAMLDSFAPLMKDMGKITGMMGIGGSPQ